MHGENWILLAPRGDHTNRYYDAPLPLPLQGDVKAYNLKAYGPVSTLGSNNTKQKIT